MQEIWKDIEGYEGLYQVSNLGNVKSIRRLQYNINTKEIYYLDTNKVLKQYYNHKGYKMVKLQKNKFKKTISVHRLVAQTFIENINNLPQVNHIDGNKENNRVDNLEWCDNTYNCNEAKRLGLQKTRKVKLSNENEIYYFDDLHQMFRFLNIKPSGSYKKFINQKIKYHNYYLCDIER